MDIFKLLIMFSVVMSYKPKKNQNQVREIIYMMKGNYLHDEGRENFSYAVYS